MATHSSDLAWRIPGTGESGGLLSMGSHRVGYSKAADQFGEEALVLMSHKTAVLLHSVGTTNQSGTPKRHILGDLPFPSGWSIHYYGILIL